MTVGPMSSKLAREIVEREHYLHRKPTVRHAFGLIDSGEIVGVVTFGQPASRQLQSGVCPSDPGLVLELNRLWVHDKMPRNTESQFVADAMRMLPPMIVISFADTAQGHQGYIYRALNFNYAGWTDMDRSKPRRSYADPAQPGRHERSNKVDIAFADRPERSLKVRYWLPTGPPATRRRLAKLCEWPTMDWKTEPPPERHMSLAAYRESRNGF